MRFSQKILLVFLTMMLVMMLSSGVVYYNYASEQIVENFNVSSRDLMRQINYSLSSQVNGLIRRANSLLTNRTFVTTLADYLSSPTEKNHIRAMGTVADFLNEISNSEPLVESMYVHTPRAGFDDFSHSRSQTFDFEQSDFVSAYAQQDSKSLQWFPLQRDVIFTRQAWVVPFVWRFSIDGFAGAKPLCYFVMQIGQDALKNVILDSYQSVDFAFVLDHYGNLIIGDEAEFSGMEQALSALEQSEEGDWEADILYAGKEYMAMHSKLEVNGWQIYILKNKTELLHSLRALRRLIVQTMLALLILGAGLMTLLTHQMTRSLSDLARRMQNVRDGDLTARFLYPYHDEVGRLADSFNYMLDELQHLMDKQNQSIEALREERNRVAAMQKQKRKAELRALQAQINPHFLYNTLNAITWQAAASGDEKICTLSHALGRFFRISLSRGAEVIPLRDEIDHVRSYLQIQQIRYGERLRFEIDAAPELLDMQIIKLVLQPLVENSIYHGIKHKERGGSIVVSARREDGFAVLSVEDDGAGIERERLETMNDELGRVISRQTEGYGIFNVNERLHLYYGGDCGLHYESEAGVFTRVTFRVPISGGEAAERAENSGR
ncbi:MAG: sensor histidine kinase [Candidatus Ventricola sp.]